MEKERIPKEYGGGTTFEFEQEEIEDILVEHLRETGEEIPSKEEVDIEFASNYDNGGAIIVQRKIRYKPRESDEDIPF